METSRERNLPYKQMESMLARKSIFAEKGSYVRRGWNKYQNGIEGDKTSSDRNFSL